MRNLATSEHLANMRRVSISGKVSTQRTAIATPKTAESQTELPDEVARQQGRILLRLDALETGPGSPDAAAADASRPELPFGQARRVSAAPSASAARLPPWSSMATVR